MSMTASEHIEAAERILEGVDRNFDDTSDPEQRDMANHVLLLAQIHATLAVAKGGRP